MDDIEDFTELPGEPRDEGLVVSKRARASRQLPRGEEEGSGVIPGAGRTIYVKSYGCGHNTSDGEVMAGLLHRAGYNVTDKLDTERIDAFLINSCTVKNPSESSFRSLVTECKQRGGQVVVTGCVPQGDAKKAEEQWGDVSVIGVQQIERVVEVVEEALRGNRVHLLGRSKKDKPSLDLPKIRRNQFVEIIPINLGCLGSCTYCKTVHARGALTSYMREQVVSRVKQSVDEGVKEIRLTSEDAGAYGLDIGTNIVELLRDVLTAVPDGVMVKLGMTNPPYMLQQLEGIAECLNHPRMYSFVHVPVQSGSDAVLGRMRREYSAEEFCRVCDELLLRVPGLQLATDIIVGFPDETEEEFQETMELLRKYQFAVCNISQFYPRPGTPAARMKKVPTHVVKDRSRRLSELFNTGIVSPYRALHNSRQRVWITEMAHDKHNLCGHTKSYVQVIVDPAEAKLGTDIFCDVTEASGRFFVRGKRVADKTASVAPYRQQQWWRWAAVLAVVLALAVAWLARIVK